LISAELYGACTAPSAVQLFSAKIAINYFNESLVPLLSIIMG